LGDGIHELYVHGAKAGNIIVLSDSVRRFVCLQFFSQAILLAPMDLPRKDFDFKNVLELFIFVADSHRWASLTQI
jgi:hypothetical protein